MDKTNVWNVKNVSGSQDSPDYVQNDYTNDSSSKSKYHIEHKYYEIRCDNMKFIADIFRDELGERDVIKIGGIKKDCMSFSVYWDDDESKMPNLDGVSYNQQCSSNTNFNLQRKHGTIKMLKIGLTFISKMYPKTEKILFKDYSFMKCHSDITIELSAFYIAKYGETWYQSKFGAKPFEKIRLYEKTLQRINESLTKPISITFDKYFDTYINGVMRNAKKYRSLLKNNYEESTSLRNFVENLHTNTKDCYVFNYWLYEFMNKIGYDKLEIPKRTFYIDTFTIQSWVMDISIQPLESQ
jgi:hypothetical protein